MTDTRKIKQPHIDAIFREYYLEELAKNPLYRHLLAAMQNKPQWSQEAWFEALGDLHDYEYACFQNAFERIQEINGQGEQGAVRLNEFVFYRSAF
ncbi:MAG: hypothetical protein Q4A84_01755 [Neisseria sp.]|uniref:hypothetical protein n=1 Tax=Neisseria sp. TaxID=192066 RepID=UPI0026DA7C5E|nr:hypothetical protein [Neisseria sp.]MDO4640416.1 hypothetical protein [Neisseria sp.]